MKSAKLLRISLRPRLDWHSAWDLGIFCQHLPSEPTSLVPSPWVRLRYTDSKFGSAHRRLHDLLPSGPGLDHIHNHRIVGFLLLITRLTQCADDRLTD